MRLTIIRSSTCWTSSSRSISTSTLKTFDVSAATRWACDVLREPLAEPARDVGVAQLGFHDLRRHEVLPYERTEALAELVFLALDDRGVRDRDAQWVFEQRGDREPVGKRADHARFGGGFDIADPGVGAVGLGPAAAEEDHSGTDEKAQRDNLHLPQAAAALCVGGGVGSR